MSLTTFLKEPEVHVKMSEYFPLPTIKLDGMMKAPPITNNYMLVATAFDYLLRFYIERHNSNVISRSWVASLIFKSFYFKQKFMEQTFKKLNPDRLTSKMIREHKIYPPEKGDNFCKYYVKYISPKDLKADYHKIKKVYDTAEINYHTYLDTGLMTDDLLRSTIGLAKIDGYVRSMQPLTGIAMFDDGDIQDLRNLINLVDMDMFRSNIICSLNPIFLAGQLVGGADADLILDNNLIDFKVTKNLIFTQSYYHQLILYLVLANLSEFRPIIDTVSVYFCRHGLLVPLKIDITSDRFNEFMIWFKQYTHFEQNKNDRSDIFKTKVYKNSKKKCFR